MTSIQWFNQDYFWVWALALLIACGGSIFEIFGRRRLRIFSNPALSGVRYGWYLKGIGLLFMALGIFSTAAIIPASTSESPKREDSRSAIGILLDSGSFRESASTPRDFSNWLGDCIQWIVENAPAEPISIWETGEPAQLLVPSTWDGDSIQLLSSVFQTAQREPREGSIPDGIARMVHEQRGIIRRIVVISAQPAEEIEHLAQAFKASENVIVFVRATSNTTHEPQFFCQDREGKWVWEVASNRLGDTLQGELNSKIMGNSWFINMSVIQMLTLLAFVFLSVESMVQLLIR
jgi:hypothetical protein